MNESTNNGQTAPAADQFNAHEAMEQFFGGINRSPIESHTNEEAPLETPVTPQQQGETNATTEPVQPASPSAEVAPAHPPAREAELQKQLKTEQKRYNDLQSDIDRRINAATKGLQDRLDALLVRLSAGQTPQSEEYLAAQQQQQQEAQLQAYVESIVQQKIAADPRVQAGSVIGDWARFRAERPDSAKYNVLITKFLEKFPAPPGKLYDQLNAAYEFWDDLATGMANGQGEAARNPQPQPTTAQPAPGYGKVTPDQAAVLAAKANAYKQEQGLSATNTAKPVVNPYGPLNKAVDQMVDAYVKKLGF